MTHDPVSGRTVYQDYFGVSVKFGQPINALVLSLDSIALPIPGRDAEIYDIAKSFIEANYPKPDEPYHVRVRWILRQQALMGNVTTSKIGSILGMHSRTLQRRLRDEGTTFDIIKDDVRRELALKYLQHTQLPLMRIAYVLGFSELSAFSRSCRRWFSRPPRELRRGAKT
jgi:AraC-like DNA-binding protein